MTLGQFETDILPEPVRRYWLFVARGEQFEEKFKSVQKTCRLTRAAIRTSPTRHLCDPSVAAAALGAGPGELMSDLNMFGLLFESMAARDLRCYADGLGGEVLHYRDKSGLECEAVIRLRDGRYGLVEAKLGGESAVGEGASSLRALAGRINAERTGSPAFMMVITGVGGMSYPRADGVYVVPLRALRP